jgi:transposase InsO family protein
VADPAIASDHASPGSPADADLNPSHTSTLEVLRGPLDSAQYTSAEYRQLCERLGVTQSMGATGICFDNAAAEAFFATLKRELVHRRRFATRAEARRQIIRWIEGWYNARRLHSTLDYLTPNEKETLYERTRDSVTSPEAA